MIADRQNCLFCCLFIKFICLFVIFAEEMLRQGKWTDKFFVITTGDDGSKAYTLKTPEQFQVHERKKIKNK